MSIVTKHYDWECTRDEVGFQHRLSTGIPGYLIRVEKTVGGDYMTTVDSPGMPVGGEVVYAASLASAKKKAQAMLKDGTWVDYAMIPEDAVVALNDAVINGVVEAPPRYATPDDHAKAIKFCLIRVEINADGFTVTPDRTLRVSVDKRRNNHFYFGSNGSIQHVELGTLRTTYSCGNTNYVGYLIDYDSNYDVAFSTACAVGRRRLQEMVSEIAAELAELQALKLVIKDQQ